MMSKARADGWWLALLLILLPVAKFFLTEAAGFDLHFDEAQYWTWSQHLDWSYYSKGPLVAWLIALSEALFGHGEWQVRLPAWLAFDAFVLLLYGFTRQLWDSRAAAWWAVGLAVTTPLYFALGTVMTTDILLLVFWAWGLWAGYRALERGQRLAWYELGAAVGLGALTKLSMGLLPFFIGLLVLANPRWRPHLLDRHLWGGLLLMLVCMSPLLGWNATHDWVMFRHELGHVGHKSWSAARALEFFASQLGALSPLVALLALSVLWRRPPETGRRLIWYVSAACLGFFIFKAASSKVQLNWAAPIYIGFLVLFAGEVLRLTRLRRGVFYAGIASSVVLISVAFFPLAFGLGGERAPLHRMKQWQTSVQELAAAAPQAQFVITHTYTWATELAYYWPGDIPVYIMPSPDRRFNQFDLWPGLETQAGKTGLFVGNREELPEPIQLAFAHCTPLAPVDAVSADGAVLRTLYPSLCEGYRPIDWPEPVGY